MPTIGICRDLRVSDILVKFSRNKTYDLVSRVNALVTLVNAGFNLEKSVELVDISDDPLQFTIDSQEMVDKIRTSSNEGIDSQNKDIDIVYKNIAYAIYKMYKIAPVEAKVRPGLKALMGLTL